MTLQMEIVTPDAYKAHVPDAPFEARICCDEPTVVDSGAYIGGAWIEPASGPDPELGFSVNIFRLPGMAINVTREAPLCLKGNVFLKDETYDSESMAAYGPGLYRVLVKVSLRIQVNGVWQHREVRADKTVRVSTG